MFEDVEAEGVRERAVGEWQREQRARAHQLGRVVRIDAFNGQAIAKGFHQYAFAAAGIEHARASRQRVEVLTHELLLGEIRRVELPVWRGNAVIVPAHGVLSRPRRGWDWHVRDST